MPLRHKNTSSFILQQRWSTCYSNLYYAPPNKIITTTTLHNTITVILQVVSHSEIVTQYSKG